MQNRKRSMMVFYILEVHIYVDMDHEKKGLRRIIEIPRILL